MSSNIDRPRFTEIPINAAIIQILDDDQDRDEIQRNYISLACGDMIDQAIITKSLDEMKRTIFMCLIRMREKSSLQKVEQKIRQKYIQYFQEKLNINISNQYHNQKYEVNNKNSEQDKHHIIVYGVDFLSNAQLESKFKGIYPVQVQRINASNASIRFHEEENSDNILEMQGFKGKPNDEFEVIEQECAFNWKPLKKYNVLGFQRALKYRFASVNEMRFEKEDFSLGNFEKAKAQIQKSKLFVQNSQQEDYFDEKLHLFEQSMNSHPRRYSRHGYSQRSQSTHRERTRDNRTGRRGELEIDQFSDRFGKRVGRKYENEFTQRNRGYRTERNNYQRRNENYTDRRREGREGRDYQDNFRDNRNNREYDNNNRSNRFFQQQKKDNEQREDKNSSKSISLQNLQKSVSRSNSSKSYGLNQDLRENTQQNNDITMSFGIPLNQNFLNVTQNNEKSTIILMDQFGNNGSMFMSQQQDVSLSFIIPENILNSKAQEDDNESVGDILERMQAKQKEFAAQKQDKSVSSRKNSSLQKSKQKLKKDRKNNSSRSVSKSVKSNQNSQKKRGNRSPENKQTDRYNNYDRGGNNNRGDRNYNRGDVNNNYGGRNNNYDRRDNYDRGDRGDRNRQGNNNYQRNYNNQTDRNTGYGRNNQNQGYRGGQGRDYGNRNRRQGQQSSFRDNSNTRPSREYNNQNSSSRNKQFNQNRDRNFNQNRQYNNDRTYNNERQYPRNEERGGNSVFEQYKKKEVKKPIQNLDEDIDY